MNEQEFIGYIKRTGHPLEVPLSDFIQENASWVLSQGAVVGFHIIEKTWAQAIVVVIPKDDTEYAEGAVRQEINRRLVAAGFKTNLPKYDRHADGHFIKDMPATGIEILGIRQAGK